MYQLVYTNRFKKDVKVLLKRGFDMPVLKNSIMELEKKGTLDLSKRPHKLSGNIKDTSRLT
jgi:mRNA interferase YafQ